MDEQSDEALLDLYFAGDAEAFRFFYERHAGRVMGYAVSKGLSREIASEVRQEAFLRLHRSIHRYEKGRPALPWFFTIVHHTVVDAMRQRKSLADLRARFSSEHIGFERVVGVSEHYSRSPVSLESLPENQRQVFEMRVLNDLSFAEISVKTGKSEVSLRKMFERARKKLRAFLDNEDEK